VGWNRNEADHDRARSDAAARSVGWNRNEADHDRARSDAAARSVGWNGNEADSGLITPKTGPSKDFSTSIGLSA
jgi:hypothetical protein